jgi:hypothetical protein
MKNILLTSVAALALTFGQAQAGFFTKTCYRGAFAPAPEPMWSDGWTNWDPNNTAYPAPTMTVAGNITTNTTWSAGQVVLLSTQIYIKNNAVLTIQPGVTVLGKKGVAGGAGIFVTKGSQIVANGTATAPIVFTSDQAPGARGLGDWAGIILMGKAAINSPNGVNNIEGLPISSDTEYGGGTAPDDNDNSGSLKYVRIEFCGFVFQTDKEINGLTLGGVGRGTTIDNIQVSFSNDDAFEWFGGTVNCKHLIAYRCLDDNFDTDFGFSGKVQFCLGVRDPSFCDNPSVSTSEGFESDNDASGSANTPVTSPIFSNVTDIGPLRGVSTATALSGFRRGARIRRNSNLKIYNSLFMDHATRGIFIDGSACETNANSGALKFKNNILAGYGVKAVEVTSSVAILTNPNAWLMSNGNDTLKATTGLLNTAYNYTAPDYRPAPGSLALTNADFTDASIAAVSSSVAALVAFTSPTAQCVDATHPMIFTPNTMVDGGYCALSWTATAGVGISSSLAVTPAFTIASAGSNTITLKVTNGDGTKVITQAIVTTTCLDVYVKELNRELSLITLYPNPSQDNTAISFYIHEASTVNLTVTDLTGKICFNRAQTVAPGKNEIGIATSHLTNGLYFVTLETASGKETVKLIVNK